MDALLFFLGIHDFWKVIIFFILLNFVTLFIASRLLAPKGPKGVCGEEEAKT